MNGKAARISEEELGVLAEVVIRVLEISCDLVQAWSLLPAGEALELMLVIWALVVAEGEGRPMAVSKLADYTGIPRATLYRRLKALEGTRVVSPDDSGFFRLTPEFAGSCALRTCVQEIAACIRSFDITPDAQGGAGRPQAVRANGAGRAEEFSVAAASAPPRPTVGAESVAIGRLVLDIVWRTGEGQEKWAGAACELVLLRWLILQAELAGRLVTVHEVAPRARISLATCYRKIGRLMERALVIRDADGGLTTAWPFLRGPQEDADLLVLRNHVGKVVQVLLRMDGKIGE